MASARYRTKIVRISPATVRSRAGRVQSLVAAAGSPVRRRSVVLFTASPSRELCDPVERCPNICSTKHMCEQTPRRVKFLAKVHDAAGSIPLAPAKSAKRQDSGEYGGRARRL